MEEKEPELVVEEEPLENESALAEVDDQDKPLTPEEIRGAALDLYDHAKNVWLRPFRKELRSWIRMGKEFLDDIGGDDK